jgi:hypothetical protein
MSQLKRLKKRQKGWDHQVKAIESYKTEIVNRIIAWRMVNNSKTGCFFLFLKKIIFFWFIQEFQVSRDREIIDHFEDEKWAQWKERAWQKKNPRTEKLVSQGNKVPINLSVLLFWIEELIWQFQRNFHNLLDVFIWTW